MPRSLRREEVEIAELETFQDPLVPSGRTYSIMRLPNTQKMLHTSQHIDKDNGFDPAKDPLVEIVFPDGWTHALHRGYVLLLTHLHLFL